MFKKKSFFEIYLYLIIAVLLSLVIFYCYNFNAHGYLYNQPWGACGPIELNHNSLLQINLTRYPLRFKGIELEVHREGEAEEHEKLARKKHGSNDYKSNIAEW